MSVQEEYFQSDVKAVFPALNAFGLTDDKPVGLSRLMDVIIAGLALLLLLPLFLLIPLAIKLDSRGPVI